MQRWKQVTARALGRTTTRAFMMAASLGVGCAAIDRACAEERPDVASAEVVVLEDRSMREASGPSIEPALLRASEVLTPTRRYAVEVIDRAGPKAPAQRAVFELPLLPGDGRSVKVRAIVGEGDARLHYRVELRQDRGPAIELSVRRSHSRQFDPMDLDLEATRAIGDAPVSFGKIQRPDGSSTEIRARPIDP